mmetsp:Transcript_5190/g.14913  ORF Transcript_5190/g.14913 Transcript_5190/m.14913 type:complete len:207 (-) Transcript_5190:111-731(-)
MTTTGRPRCTRREFPASAPPSSSTRCSQRSTLSMTCRLRRCTTWCAPPRRFRCSRRGGRSSRKEAQTAPAPPPALAATPTPRCIWTLMPSTIGVGRRSSTCAPARFAAPSLTPASRTFTRRRRRQASPPCRSASGTWMSSARSWRAASSSQTTCTSCAPTTLSTRRRPAGASRSRRHCAMRSAVCRGHATCRRPAGRRCSAGRRRS